MDGLKPIKLQLSDYELIDSGDFAKLERFGGRVTARPEPQAIWRKGLSDEEWARLADATFSKAESRGGFDKASEERGRWELKPAMPDRWTMRYDYDQMHLTLRLALTGFKHVGVFPEQAANWNFIYDTLRSMPARASVLNLFAYTGGATLAARSAGADVTHVDSVKQTVGWARDNMTLSGLDGVRWIVDDALKFVQREVRRGRQYDGIVLDPPAYGRGPDGEKWVLEQNIDEMLALCAQLLKPHGFLVLNLYSMGLSALVARSAVRGLFGKPATEQFGELYFSDRAGNDLPLGVYYRMTR
jgi:23S rRNA (cytosine1962-C5)-methyltransferase